MADLSAATAHPAETCDVHPTQRTDDANIVDTAIKPSPKYRHAFIAWFESHPARHVARLDSQFVAELMAHPVYCLASQVSELRWELISRRRAQLQPHSRQWHACDIWVGLKQRGRLISRAALSEALVQKLMCFRGACSVGRLPHHTKCVVSQRHFLVSKGLAEGVFQEGQLLYEQERYGDAARSWGQAALLQHGASHAFLSSMLFEGRPGVAKDERQALELAAAGAAMSCAHSKGALARCYCFGYSAAAHEATGLKLGGESAAAGSCFGQFVVGACYLEGRDVQYEPAEAARLLRLAVEQGHAEAQFTLGRMFEDGSGVAADKAEAVRLYRLAAAHGHAGAQSNLASMLYKGDCVAQDVVEARRLWLVSAAQGCKSAEFNLGLMFEYGLDKDEAEAMRWYRLAAAQGHAVAQFKCRRHDCA